MLAFALLIPLMFFALLLFLPIMAALMRHAAVIFDGLIYVFLAGFFFPAAYYATGAMGVSESKSVLIGAVIWAVAFLGLISSKWVSRLVFELIFREGHEKKREAKARRLAELWVDERIIKQTELFTEEGRQELIQAATDEFLWQRLPNTSKFRPSSDKIAYLEDCAEFSEIINDPFVIDSRFADLLVKRFVRPADGNPLMSAVQALTERNICTNGNMIQVLRVWRTEWDKFYQLHDIHWQTPRVDRLITDLFGSQHR